MGCDLGRELDRTEAAKTGVLSPSRGRDESNWAPQITARVSLPGNNMQDMSEDARMLTTVDAACEPTLGLTNASAGRGCLPNCPEAQSTACPKGDEVCPTGEEALPAGRLPGSSRPRKAEGRQRSRSAPKGGVEALERFADRLNFSSLPIIMFSESVDEMRVWKRGSIRQGEVQLPKRSPDLAIREPIAMSPAYLGFALEPSAPRVLQCGGVGLVFQRPRAGLFMQPSIDTMLLCGGLRRLFDEEASAFRRAVDIGSGSGFIGKFAAVHAPGPGELSMTLCDIDPAALEYSRSPGFAAPSTGSRGRAVSWERQVADATELLRREDSDFDLLLSNPPYIPTRDEVTLGHRTRPSGSAGHKSFWEGIGLVVFLIEHFAARSCPPNAHMVLVLTSLTLKAPGVLEALEAARERGVRCRALLEREVAWKAWYAGPSGNEYLMASQTEQRERKRLDAGLEVFVGATRPGRSRLQKVTDGRQYFQSYHWHVVYVLDFSYV